MWQNFKYFYLPWIILEWFIHHHLESSVKVFLYYIGLIQFNSFSGSVMSNFFVTTWTAACQASLSITNYQSLLKLMSIELVMPSHHLILYHPLLLLPSILPSFRIFSSELALHIRWPKCWSFNFSISPSKEYSGRCPLRLTGLISLLSKGLSRVFSRPTVWKHQFLGTQPSLWYNSHICTSLQKPQLWVDRTLSAKWCLWIIICWLEKAMAPTPVLLPEESHGQRSLVGCSPCGR